MRKHPNLYLQSYFSSLKILIRVNGQIWAWTGAQSLGRESLASTPVGTAAGSPRSLEQASSKPTLETEGRGKDQYLFIYQLPHVFYKGPGTLLSVFCMPSSLILQ